MIDLQFMPIAAQIVLGRFQRPLAQSPGNEALPDLESGLSYLIVILRLGLGRRCPRTIQAPAALLAALEQPGKTSAVGIGVPRVIGRKRDVGSGANQSRIGAQPGLNL